LCHSILEGEFDPPETGRPVSRPHHPTTKD
jgi:hypothetical protein